MVLAGSIFLAFSLGTSALAIAAGIAGIAKKDENYLILSRQAVYLHFLTLAFAMLVLIYLLVLPDLSVIYVVQNVNHALPLFYKITAVWAGQAGSMLFWNFLLALFSVLAVNHVQRKEPVLVPYMILILMATSMFFSILGNFTETSDPFVLWHQNGVPLAANDGRGLNPLLQHWAMTIHPPILLTGYVAFAVPFSIAMAALMSGRMNLNWTRLVRRWTLFSWFSLGTGIMLGSKWAYEELGWGGYWAWDPVENASLMPWLTGTAFLHSILVQEKRGMLKVWNMVLVSISFLMCIFGTFLTRSGVVSSVHAFADSNLGPFFVAYMVLVICFSVYYIVTNLQRLRSDRPINSFISREAGFLFNNVLLVVMLFTVIWGTMYPAFTEFFFHERVSVSAIWFNKFMAPLGLILMFLTGAGPLLAWRTTAPETLLKNFFWPLVAGLVTALAFFTVRYFIAANAGEAVEWHRMAGLAFSLCAFVVAGVVDEWIRTTVTRKRFTGENVFIAFLLIFFQNKRRYLGYAVHLGLAILFVGFTGKSFTTETKMTLGSGEAEYFNGYMIKVNSLQQIQVPPGTQDVPLYVSKAAAIQVYKDNRLVGDTLTEVRTYPMFSFQTGQYDRTQDTSEPGILSTPLEDIYVQLGGVAEDGRAIIQVWINPLVGWVWFGFYFYTLMILVLLLPIGEGRTIRLFQRDYPVAPGRAA